MKTIKKLNKEENITTLHITHFMEEAVRADRVIVMDSGEVSMFGSVEDILPKLQAKKLCSKLQGDSYE